MGRRHLPTIGIPMRGTAKVQPDKDDNLPRAVLVSPFQKINPASPDIKVK